MPYTDTNVKDLVINVLTSEQYNSISDPSETELYLITDDTNVAAGTGISVSTSNGISTIGHSNSVTAQNTQAVYPIKIDAQGHISSYGSAVTVGSGTVTSVATGIGLTGGPITTSGTISLDTTYALSASDISTGTSTDPKLVSAKVLADEFGESAVIRRWS